jgi:aconitate hydratase 2/2-methylisocitrate dehydratase
MGKDAQVYLGSAELAAFCSILGYIPTKSEYLTLMSDKINQNAGEIYQYLNFNLMDDYKTKKVIEINPAN